MHCKEESHSAFISFQHSPGDWVPDKFISKVIEHAASHYSHPREGPEKNPAILNIATKISQTTVLWVASLF
jgi:hypothetical protein